MSHEPEQLITDMNARDYFQDAVHTAVTRQQVTVSGETVIYITNLLTDFVFTERLYEATPDGIMMTPLASLYGQALQAPTVEDRNKSLRRLGDIALFVSGLFAQSLSRSLVDVDYYIAMGGNAYGCLADTRHRSRQLQAMKDVFQELATRFSEFVDVLSEVSDNANLGNSNDTLRWYEIWLSSGSPRAEEKLRAQGIQPIPLQRRQH